MGRCCSEMFSTICKKCMKKYLVIIVCFFLFTILHLSCKKKMKIDQARVEIERYLDKEFGNSFNINSIAKDYNPDMFHDRL